MTRHLLVLGVGLAALLAGCLAEDDGSSSLEPGPEMRPGWNCLSCHREGGQASRAIWTAGGTVVDRPGGAPTTDGLEDVEVLFFDPSGDNVIHRARTNRVGNFFSRAPLPEGFRVGIEYEGRRIMMPIPPPAGSCNACHAERPIGGAMGPIYAP